MFGFFNNQINTAGDDDLAIALRGAAIKEARQDAREAGVQALDELFDGEAVRYSFVARVPQDQWERCFLAAKGGGKGSVLAGPRGSTYKVHYRGGKIVMVRK